MLVAGLPLAPTTGLAERNTPQAMRCCQIQWGFASDGGADKGYIAGTSSDVCVSTGFVLTSPELAAGAPPVGTACSGGTRIIT